MNNQDRASAPTNVHPLLTIPEVAQRLGVSSSTVRRLVDRGELARVRVGHSIRFREADLAGLIDGGDSAPEARDPTGRPGRAGAAGGDGRRAPE